MRPRARTRSARPRPATACRPMSSSRLASSPQPGSPARSRRAASLTPEPRDQAGRTAMTLQDWGSLGEVVGALAVVVTLIYLAKQIRLNTHAMEEARRLAL